MTAMTQSKLSQRIAASAGSITPAAKIEELAKRAWTDMRDHSVGSLTHEGKSGYRYKGNLTQAQNRVAGAERRKLSTDERDVLDNAVRQFLRYSGNAKCIKREPRDQIEWWVSANWSSAIAVPVVTASKMPNGQENWFERKVRPEEITGGFEPFPVTVTKPEATAAPTPAFSDTEADRPKVEPFPVDTRWRIELMRTLKRGTENSTLHQVMAMAATWDDPFTSDTYAQLYASNTLEPSAMLLTLRDADLVNAQPTATRGGGSTYTTTPAQKLAIQSILSEYPTTTLPPWKLEDTREALLDALFIRNFQTTEDLARKVCMNRAKMVGALGKMASEGLVERRRPHREAEWRLATTKASPEPTTQNDERMTTASSTKPAAPTAPAPQPPAVPVPRPVPQNPSLIPASTVEIAKTIDRLVEVRIKDAVAEKDEYIASLESEVSDLQRKIADLEDWKTKFKAFLSE